MLQHDWHGCRHHKVPELYQDVPVTEFDIFHAYDLVFSEIFRSLHLSIFHSYLSAFFQCLTGMTPFARSQEFMADFKQNIYITSFTVSLQYKLSGTSAHSV
jgi:hypothetical protein